VKVTRSAHELSAAGRPRRMASVGAVTLVAGRAAPTLDDARLAAQALVGAGVREVWLYGSVARGESAPGSDIDLVAVLDDLEYRRRLRVKSELQEAARQACGCWVEVLVTDRAEWRIQREQVSASFASAISCDLTLIACSYDVTVEVDWGKEQVMATSNGELALERLRGVLLNLTKIDATRAPSAAERDLVDDDDPGDHLLVRGGRLVMLCEAADMAVENAAKAVGVLSGVKAQTLWEHDVGKIVDELGGEDTDAFRDLMAAAPELVKSPDYVTMWRTRGAYGSTTEGKTAPEVATAAFARAIGLIACEVAAYAAEAVGRRMGAHKDIADVRRWASRVRGYLRERDLASGEQLPADV